MRIGVISFVLLIWAQMLTAKSIVTIVVLEGKAMLVTVDENGTVLDTYMEVPEYLTDGQDHNKKVENAKRNYEFLSKQEINQIRFIPLVGVNAEMDQHVTSNLADLAHHYHDTFANEIIITVAKNKRTEHLIDQSLEVIIRELAKLGVVEKDIRIDEKIDMGDEPTQFIKVVSHLKTLPTL